MLRTADKRLLVNRGLRDLISDPLSGYGDLRLGLHLIDGFASRFDASDTGSLTIESSAVSTWNDLGTNAFHLTQATSGNRPRYTSDTINGIVVPRFDGSDDYMDFSFVSQASYTWHFVAYYETIGTEATLIGDKNTDGGPTIRVDTSGHVQLLHSNQSLDFTSSGAFAVNTPFVLSVRHTSGSNAWKIWRDSSTETPSALSVSTGVAMRIGSDKTGAPYKGGIGEMVYYDSALSDTEVEKNIAYLTGKWL